MSRARKNVAGRGTDIVECGVCGGEKLGAAQVWLTFKLAHRGGHVHRNGLKTGADIYQEQFTSSGAEFSPHPLACRRPLGSSSISGRSDAPFVME